MRTFIAIEIDEEIKSQIGLLQEKLRRKAETEKGHAKWVNPEIIHLTLKFLGEVKDKDINTVCQITEETVACHNKFSLDIRKVGTFGSPARVVWAGIEKNSELFNLQQDLANRLDKAGWPKEKRAYSAHLTLCRIKKPSAGRKIQNIIEDFCDIKFGICEVNSVCVFKSDLTKMGPEYTLLSRSMLM